MTTAAERAIPDVRAVQRRTLAVLIVAQVIGTVGVGVAPSIGILLASEVTGDEAMAGLARTASTLGAALFGLPLGTLAAQRGRRVALTLGWLLAAFGSALLVAAAQWSLVVPLFIGLLLIGAGSAVALQARFAATDLAEPHHKARSLALVVWVGTLGSVLGPNLGLPGEIVGAATGLTVFASAFLIATVCLAVAGGVVFVGLRPDPLIVARELVGQHREEGVHVEPTAAQTAQRRTTLIMVIASIAASHAVMVSVMSMTPVHLTSHGAALVVVGVVISLHVAGMYALSPLFGWWSDRGSRIVVMVAGYLILAAALVVLGLAPNDHTLVAVGLTLLGLGWSAATVAGSALVTDLSNGPERVRVQGRSDMTMSLSGAAAGALAGPVLAVVGYGGLAVVTGVLVAGLLVLAALIRIRLRAH